MDLVSVETSPENEWIKQRIVDGKVRILFGSDMNVNRPAAGIMYLCHNLDRADALRIGNFSLLRSFSGTSRVNYF